MLSTYKNMRKLEKKETFKILKSVQDCIPIKRVWKDGIFQTTDKGSGLNQYSITYKIQDINFSICSPAEKKNKFLLWEKVLNTFDPDARYKLTIFKHKINVEELYQSVAMQDKNDKYDEFRHVFNNVVTEKVLVGNGITQEIYLTVSSWKKDYNSAKTFFSRTFHQIDQAFISLGTCIEQLNAIDRLRIFHDFYRSDSVEDYNLNFDDMLKQGKDIKDYICPDVISFDNHSADYLKINQTYCRALYVRNYASQIDYKIVSELCNIDRPSCFSIDLVAIPKNEAITAAQDIRTKMDSNINKYNDRNQNRGKFYVSPTYDMVQQLNEATEWLDDLTNRDQSMFVANISMIHLADTKEELEEDTKEILAAARQNMCQMGILTFQQLQGVVTALPYGVNRLSAEMTLSTEGASIFLPFRAQEVMDKNGYYCGTNSITGNLVLINPDKLDNPNRFVIGVPGSGKSFFVKNNVYEIFLNTNNDIIIVDPEREYRDLVENLGGKVIELSTNSDTHINPFDMTKDYGEKEGRGYYDKSMFITSLLEQIDQAKLITAGEKSIIDRCVIDLYKTLSTTPTLIDLKNKLLEQKEPIAKELALKLELFTTGSLNCFSKETNIDFNNRIICFDTSELKGDLNTIGILIVIDCLVNIVSNNFKNGKRTSLFIDEFQTLLKSEYSAQYFNSAWRRYRKRGASPCGITQNVSYMISNVEFSTMLGNSTWVTLFRLTPEDRAIVSDLYNLSEEQLNYISENTKPGNGIMKVESNIIPFDGQFPKDNKLYKLMTTKAGEWNG